MMLAAKNRGLLPAAVSAKKTRLARLRAVDALAKKRDVFGLMQVMNESPHKDAAERAEEKLNGCSFK